MNSKLQPVVVAEVGPSRYLVELAVGGGEYQPARYYHSPAEAVDYARYWVNGRPGATARVIDTNPEQG